MTLSTGHLIFGSGANRNFAKLFTQLPYIPIFRHISSVAIALVVVTALLRWDSFALLDNRLFDIQIEVIRSLRPDLHTGTGPEIQIVGIDERTLQSVDVPIALIHRPLGQALESISDAGACAIAIDLVLPVRSFDHLLPGSDAALLRGLSHATQRTAVVAVVDSDSEGRLRIPYAPFVAVIGERSLVTAQMPLDPDGVVRRFDPGLSVPRLRTLAGEVSYRLSGDSTAQLPGWIDYTRGSAFSYIPLVEVFEAARLHQRQKLKEWFTGKVVLVGSVLPYVDRVSQPVSLVGWEYPNTAPPAVIIHAQLLRSMLGSGLINSAPQWSKAGLILAFLAIGWFPGVRLRFWGLAAAGVGVLILSTVLVTIGWRLETFGALLGGVIVAAIRTSRELTLARRERMQLEQTFAGYVSPQVLRRILAGRLGTGVGRRTMAFLFVDLRGFTTWSEISEPERTFRVLNEYFALVTPRIHQRGGTIDNFRGDGLMVLFGAPEPHPDPCGAAFETARDVVTHGRRLLALLPESMNAGLDLAVGISYGEAVVGNLGSEERMDFTAIGDAVNVAARLQELTKSLGFPILMTKAVFDRVDPILWMGQTSDQTPQALGEVPLRGHSPVSVVGWQLAQ